MVISNLTEISDNQTQTSEDIHVFDSLDAAFDSELFMFGEYFWVCAYFPVAVIGVFLNLFSFIVFQKQEFNLKLYSYFRYMTFASFVYCVSVTPYPFSIAKRLGFVNNFAFQAWQCYYYIPMSNLCYYYVSFIDIAVLIDRLSIFLPRLRSVYEKLQANHICISVFFVDLIINFPYFFVFQPIIIPLYYHETNKSGVELYEAYFVGPTDFALSTTGQIVTYIVYAIRDFACILIIIILNLLNLYFIKRYLRVKSTILKDINVSIDKNVSNDQTFSDISNKNRIKDIKSKRKLGIMVVFMCMISLISHLIFFSAVICFNFYSNPSVTLYIQLAEFLNTFNIFLNFFIFYTFIKNFKIGLKRIIKFRS